MGWLLAYMQFDDMAVAWVTTASQSTLMVLFTFAAVMVVLGTFVDSLAILLVFAPVAVQLSKQYGIDPLQMGLVMVMCNQIGAVSPPTAPLLFVTTNIAKTTFDDTNRHVWPFFAAECLVLLLVILIPGLSNWIARDFLGSVRENKRRDEALPIATDPRLRELERRLYELEAQQASFSELIKALAEQNDALVKTLGMVHARLRLVLVVFTALAIVLAVVIWRLMAA